MIIIQHSSILSLKSNILSDSFDFWGFIIYLLFVLLLLYLVYVSTKFIAQSYSRVGSKRHIRFLEKCVLGLDKAVYMIQIEEENLYLYVDKNTCKILKKTEISKNESDSEQMPRPLNQKEKFLEILLKKRLIRKGEITDNDKCDKSSGASGGVE